MEKRHSKRRVVSLEASLTTKESRYPAYIENICENGIHCIVPSVKHVLYFVPENICELKCWHNDEYETWLQCEIRWVHINKTPILGYTYRMGMEVLNRQFEYQELPGNY